MITRAKACIFKPKIYSVVKPICDFIYEPTTNEEALLDSKWKAAMENKYNALMTNKTLNY